MKTIPTSARLKMFVIIFLHLALLLFIFNSFYPISDAINSLTTGTVNLVQNIIQSVSYGISHIFDPFKIKLL